VVNTDEDKKRYHIAFSLLVFSHLLAEGDVVARSLRYAMRAYEEANQR
jgi:hypothetical protein